MVWKHIALVILLGIIGIAVAQEVNVSVNVLQQPYISVTFHYNSVNFGSIYQGTYNVRPTPDYTTGAYRVTVNTNSNYYVYARESGNFSNSGLTLRMAVSNNPNVDGTFYALTTSNTQIYSGSAGNYNQYHQYLLDVPSNVEPGTYSTTVYITYSL